MSGGGYLSSLQGPHKVASDVQYQMLLVAAAGLRGKNPTQRNEKPGSFIPPSRRATKVAFKSLSYHHTTSLSSMLSAQDAKHTLLLARREDEVPGLRYKITH